MEFIDYNKQIAFMYYNFIYTNVRVLCVLLYLSGLILSSSVYHRLVSLRDK